MLRSLVNEQIAAALHADVAAVCHEQGCTQEEVAEALREQPKTLSGYLCGHARVPADLIIKVAKKLRRYQALETVQRLATPHGLAVADLPHVLEAVRIAAHDTTEAITAVIGDAEDGCIDQLDVDRREITEGIDALRRLLARLECADATPARAASLREAE